MPCGIRSQPLRVLDQVVRIEHRCRSLCCFERVRSVRATERRSKDPVQEAQGKNDKSTPKRSSPARSGDAIKVSARDGQSYADILKEMKAKVDPRKAGLEVQSIRRTRKEEVLLVLKKGETFQPSERSSNWRSGKRRKFQP